VYLKHNVWAPTQRRENYKKGHNITVKKEERWREITGER
jgi:hypothetical protein